MYLPSARIVVAFKTCLLLSLMFLCYSDVPAFEFEFDVEGVEHELGFSEIDSISRGHAIDPFDDDEQEAMMRVVAVLKEARLYSEHVTQNDSVVPKNGDIINSNTELSAQPSNDELLVNEPNKTPSGKDVSINRNKGMVFRIVISGALATIISQPFSNIIQFFSSQFVTQILKNIKVQVNHISFRSISLQNLKQIFTSNSIETMIKKTILSLKSGFIHFPHMDIQSLVSSLQSSLPLGAIRFAVLEEFNHILSHSKLPLLSMQFTSDVISSAFGSLFSKLARALYLSKHLKSATIHLDPPGLLRDLTLNTITFTIFHFQRRNFQRITSWQPNFLLDLSLGAIAATVAVTVTFYTRLITDVRQVAMEIIPVLSVLYASYEAMKGS